MNYSIYLALMMAFAGSSPDQRQGSRQSWMECCERQDKLRKDLPGLFRGVDEDWHRAAKQNDFSRLDPVRNLARKMTLENYTRTLRTLLNMVRSHDAINERKFDMFKQRLRLLDGRLPDIPPDRYGIEVEGLSNGQPSLIPSDFVIMRNFKGIYTVTKIEEVIEDIVVLPSEIRPEGDLSGQLDIYFVSSGILYKYYERALTRFDEDSSVRNRLFKGATGRSQTSKSRSRLKFRSGSESKTRSEPGIMSCFLIEAEQRMEKLNEHQRLAIFSVLENTSWPKPYILFGPPGTGKTHTLAEAIAQIYIRKRGSRILYCANSNTCADQMVDKLKKISLIDPNDIQRLSAGENPRKVGVSRIMVTTNMKSSSLMVDYAFDYVIVDEAGHAHEAETLIPICCVTGKGCLVLAGDPKQLGPVVKCWQADKYGLGKSLLERLFNFDIYRRASTTGQYDCKYIKKLLLSYRCDPRILAIPNELFYDNELECANETPKLILKILNMSNPLQFLNVGGQEQRPELSTSRCNFLEIDHCVNLIIRLYKMGLTPDQIGVISPYKLQANMIRKRLDLKLRDCRDLLEKRLQEVEMIEREESRKKAVENSHTKAKLPRSKPPVFDLEKLKLGQVEEFDLKQQENEANDPGELIEIKRRADEWLCKISSVDAFQGDEREVIIISTVRTPSGECKDFINDDRRFNVAISRAEWLVFVIGHKSVLEEQSNWNEFMSRASEETNSWLIRPQRTGSKYQFKQIRSLLKKALKGFFISS